ncbi:hypothetical protein O3G_MSEX008212 [Manduca sexta]|uniref:Uncharacterized protein n=1 Tax=Manduca sexta TaxID=7130 RepID=A0A921Z8W8_MANSE|nr:hypothetical protein O3G_MSEX008212 [Manduca sexta]
MSRIINIICVFLFFVKTCKCSVKEFGVDHTKTTVIVHNRGMMSEGQVKKIIPMKVPKCYKIIYVRVEVANDETSPKIKFDKKAKIIIIDYVTPPNTESQYEIIVKGVEEQKCRDTVPETYRKIATETPAHGYKGKLLPASYRVSYI